VAEVVEEMRVEVGQGVNTTKSIAMMLPLLSVMSTRGTLTTAVVIDATNIEMGKERRSEVLLQTVTINPHS